MTLTAANVYRAWKTPGVPGSGEHWPSKTEIIQLLQAMDSRIASGGVSRATLAQLETITPADGTFPAGRVTADPVETNNGEYVWDGSVWVRTRGLPDTLARLTDVGGSANAVTASTAAGVDPGTVVELLIEPVLTNTTAVTLSVNGGSAKPVLDVNGNALTAGLWVAGRLLTLVDDGTEYRLASDPDADAAAALAAASAASAEADAEAAELSRLAAEAAAALSGPTAVLSKAFAGDGVTTTFTLDAEPSSAAHVLVVLDGVLQEPEEAYSVSGVTLTFESPPPAPSVGDLKNISTRIISIADGEDVPPDGSVTSAKLGARAATFGKVQAIQSARFLGRTTAGSGDIEELTAAQLRDAIAAAGRVCFVANKGGTNQTGIASVTETKVTFGTEVVDIGGHYDAANSRWTPPAGLVQLTATAFISGALVNGGTAYLVIRKNGSNFRLGASQNGSNLTVSAASVSALDAANGTDYYEIFVFLTTSSSTGTVSGLVTASRFEGFVL